jgi:hypothetical protein
MNENQDFIFDNEEIFNRISLELRKAQKSIKVAAAWFTDPDLLAILIEKASQGIKVDVIISDNVNNEKLDFDELKRLGGTVLRVKNTGYGMMHQKFCIIDDCIAIHGSYNWSVNARTNNDESITITDIPYMVNKMSQHFENIKSKGDKIEEKGKLNLKNLITSVFRSSNGKKTSEELRSEGGEQLVRKESEKDIQIELSQEEKDKLDYEKVLDQMIAAEVSNFDRNLLKQEGYERAKLNNGDSQVLCSALDSVYSVFINDINVVEDKKNRLTARIKEHEVRILDSSKEKIELRKKTTEEEFTNKSQNIDSRLTTIKTQIQTLQNEIKQIQEIDIAEHERKKGLFKVKIHELELEFVKPAIRWFEFIPTFSFFLGILGYLILFYSSAAYILIFSEADAKTAQFNGTLASLPPPEVFNPDAMPLALEKGFGGIAMVFLFVFIPLTLSIVDNFLTGMKNWLSTLIAFILIIIVDGFIAYKVAASIHQIELLTGKTIEPWTWTNAFTNVNFYLVFVLGALGLLMFKLIYKKLISLFSERNPDLEKQKKKTESKQYLIDTEDLNTLIKESKNKIMEKESQILFHENESVNLTAIKENLPSIKVSTIEKIDLELNLKIQNIKSITAIYNSHIENDKLPISIDSINDRINIYLEGWSNYLHDIYSISKATTMAQSALEEAKKWKEDRIQKKLIDFRITNL